METLHVPPASRNTPADDTSPLTAADALDRARTQLLEASALVEVVADALADLPPGVIDERIQALANVSDRACRAALRAIEQLAAARPDPIAPAAPPLPPR